MKPSPDTRPPDAMKPITIEGCACVIGRMYGPGSAWIVREPITGLAVSDPSRTRKEAIGYATEKIKLFGGKETFDRAVQTKLNETTP